MFYQNLLKDELSYHVGANYANYYPPHIHHEIEIIYCLEGNEDIVLNGQTYHLKKDSFALAGGMVSHEYLESKEAIRLDIEIGPVFLREDYRQFNGLLADNPVMHLGEERENENRIRIRELFREIGTDYLKNREIDNMIVKGNLYKLCGMLLKEFGGQGQYVQQSGCDIYRALDLVYHHYSEPLTVETAARVAGYSRSNFCILFKKVTGIPFHAYLNDYRIKKAVDLMYETSDSIETVGFRVGFNDLKTFCRVFKKMMGVSPAEYRSRLVQRSF